SSLTGLRVGSARRVGNGPDAAGWAGGVMPPAPAVPELSEIREKHADGKSTTVGVNRDIPVVQAGRVTTVLPALSFAQIVGAFGRERPYARLATARRAWAA